MLTTRGGLRGHQRGTRQHDEQEEGDSDDAAAKDDDGHSSASSSSSSATSDSMMASDSDDDGSRGVVGGTSHHQHHTASTVTAGDRHRRLRRDDSGDASDNEKDDDDDEEGPEQRCASGNTLEIQDAGAGLFDSTSDPFAAQGHTMKKVVKKKRRSLASVELHHQTRRQHDGYSDDDEASTTARDSTAADPSAPSFASRASALARMLLLASTKNAEKQQSRRSDEAVPVDAVPAPARDETVSLVAAAAAHTVRVDPTSMPQSEEVVVTLEEAIRRQSRVQRPPSRKPRTVFAESASEFVRPSHMRLADVVCSGFASSRPPPVGASTDGAKSTGSSTNSSEDDEGGDGDGNRLLDGGGNENTHRRRQSVNREEDAEDPAASSITARLAAARWRATLMIQNALGQPSSSSDPAPPEVDIDGVCENMAEHHSGSKRAAASPRPPRWVTERFPGLFSCATHANSTTSVFVDISDRSTIWRALDNKKPQSPSSALNDGGNDAREADDRIRPQWWSVKRVELVGALSHSRGFLRAWEKVLHDGCAVHEGDEEDDLEQSIDAAAPTRYQQLRNVQRSLEGGGDAAMRRLSGRGDAVLAGISIPDAVWLGDDRQHNDDDGHSSQHTGRRPHTEEEGGLGICSVARYGDVTLADFFFPAILALQRTTTGGEDSQPSRGESWLPVSHHERRLELWFRPILDAVCTSLLKVTFNRRQQHVRRYQRRRGKDEEQEEVGSGGRPEDEGASSIAFHGNIKMTNIVITDVEKTTTTSSGPERIGVQLRDPLMHWTQSLLHCGEDYSPLPHDVALWILSCQQSRRFGRRGDEPAPRGEQTPDDDNGDVVTAGDAIMQYYGGTAEEDYHEHGGEQDGDDVDDLRISMADDWYAVGTIVEAVALSQPPRGYAMSLAAAAALRTSMPTTRELRRLQPASLDDDTRSGRGGTARGTDANPAAAAVVTEEEGHPFQTPPPRGGPPPLPRPTPPAAPSLPASGEELLAWGSPATARWLRLADACFNVARRFAVDEPPSLPAMMMLHRTPPSEEGDSTDPTPRRPSSGGGDDSQPGARSHGEPTQETDGAEDDDEEGSDSVVDDCYVAWLVQQELTAILPFATGGANWRPLAEAPLGLRGGSVVVDDAQLALSTVHDSARRLLSIVCSEHSDREVAADTDHSASIVPLRVIRRAAWAAYGGAPDAAGRPVGKRRVGSNGASTTTTTTLRPNSHETPWKHHRVATWTTVEPPPPPSTGSGGDPNAPPLYVLLRGNLKQDDAAAPHTADDDDEDLTAACDWLVIRDLTDVVADDLSAAVIAATVADPSSHWETTTTTTTTTAAATAATLPSSPLPLCILLINCHRCQLTLPSCAVCLLGPGTSHCRLALDGCSALFVAEAEADDSGGATVVEETDPLPSLEVTSSRDVKEPSPSSDALAPQQGAQHPFQQLRVVATPPFVRHCDILAPVPNPPVVLQFPTSVFAAVVRCRPPSSEEEEEDDGVSPGIIFDSFRCPKATAAAFGDENEKDEHNATASSWSGRPLGILASYFLSASRIRQCVEQRCALQSPLLMQAEDVFFQFMSEVRPPRRGGGGERGGGGRGRWDGAMAVEGALTTMMVAGAEQLLPPPPAGNHHPAKTLTDDDLLRLHQARMGVEHRRFEGGEETAASRSTRNKDEATSPSVAPPRNDVASSSSFIDSADPKAAPRPLMLSTLMHEHAVFPRRPWWQNNSHQPSTTASSSGIQPPVDGAATTEDEMPGVAEVYHPGQLHEHIVFVDATTRRCSMESPTLPSSTPAGASSSSSISSLPPQSRATTLRPMTADRPKSANSRRGPHERVAAQTSSRASGVTTSQPKHGGDRDRMVRLYPPVWCLYLDLLHGLHLTASLVDRPSGIAIGPTTQIPHLCEVIGAVIRGPVTIRVVDTTRLSATSASASSALASPLQHEIREGVPRTTGGEVDGSTPSPLLLSVGFSGLIVAGSLTLELTADALKAANGRDIVIDVNCSFLDSSCSRRREDEDDEAAAASIAGVHPPVVRVVFLPDDEGLKGTLSSSSALSSGAAVVSNILVRIRPFALALPFLSDLVKLATTSTDHATSGEEGGEEDEGGSIAWRVLSPSDVIARAGAYHKRRIPMPRWFNKSDSDRRGIAWFGAVEMGNEEEEEETEAQRAIALADDDGANDAADVDEPVARRFYCPATPRYGGGGGGVALYALSIVHDASTDDPVPLRLAGLADPSFVPPELMSPFESRSWGSDGRSRSNDQGSLFSAPPSASTTASSAVGSGMIGDARTHGASRVSQMRNTAMAMPMGALPLWTPSELVTWARWARRQSTRIAAAMMSGAERGGTEEEAAVSSSSSCPPLVTLFRRSGSVIDVRNSSSSSDLHSATRGTRVGMTRRTVPSSTEGERSFSSPMPLIIPTTETPPDEAAPPCRSLLIEDVHGGVLHFADPISEELCIRHCTGPLEIIVPVAARVRLERCRHVTLHVLCETLVVDDCFNCDLHVLFVEPPTPGAGGPVAPSAAEASSWRRHRILLPRRLWFDGTDLSRREPRDNDTAATNKVHHTDRRASTARSSSSSSSSSSRWPSFMVRLAPFNVRCGGILTIDDLMAMVVACRLPFGRSSPCAGDDAEERSGDEAAWQLPRGLFPSVAVALNEGGGLTELEMGLTDDDHKQIAEGAADAKENDEAGPTGHVRKRAADWILLGAIPQLPSGEHSNVLENAGRAGSLEAQWSWWITRSITEVMRVRNSSSSHYNLRPTIAATLTKTSTTEADPVVPSKDRPSLLAAAGRPRDPNVPPPCSSSSPPHQHDSSSSTSAEGGKLCDGEDGRWGGRDPPSGALRHPLAGGVRVAARDLGGLHSERSPRSPSPSPDSSSASSECSRPTAARELDVGGLRPSSEGYVDDDASSSPIRAQEEEAERERQRLLHRARLQQRLLTAQRGRRGEREVTVSQCAADERSSSGQRHIEEGEGPPSTGGGRQGRGTGTEAWWESVFAARRAEASAVRQEDADDEVRRDQRANDDDDHRTGAHDNDNGKAGGVEGDDEACERSRHQRPSVKRLSKAEMWDADSDEDGKNAQPPRPSTTSFSAGRPSSAAPSSRRATAMLLTLSPESIVQASIMAQADPRAPRETAAARQEQTVASPPSSSHPSTTGTNDIGAHHGNGAAPAWSPLAGGSGTSPPPLSVTSPVTQQQRPPLHPSSTSASRSAPRRGGSPVAAPQRHAPSKDRSESAPRGSSLLRQEERERDGDDDDDDVASASVAKVVDSLRELVFSGTTRENFWNGEENSECRRTKPPLSTAGTEPPPPLVDSQRPFQTTDPTAAALYGQLDAALAARQRAWLELRCTLEQESIPPSASST